MQPAEALLLGFIGAFALVVSAALIWVIHSIGSKVDDAHKTLTAFEHRVNAAAATLQEIKESTQLLTPAIRAVLHTAKAMNETSEAIRGLSSLMTNKPAEEQQAAAPWRPGGPSPANPLFDAFAPPEEAGYLEQTDEQLAEIERQDNLREQGIETDPMRIPKPDLDKMNYGGSV